MIERAVTTRLFHWVSFLFFFFLNMIIFVLPVFDWITKNYFLVSLFHFPLNEDNTITTYTITSATKLLFLYQCCFTFFSIS